MTKDYWIAEYRPKTWVISEFGLDTVYLLEGDNAALLVDTGTGVGDLRGAIEQLTQKPLIIALTHGHVDHAGGINQFSEVWVHPTDEQMAVETMNGVEARKGYASMFKKFFPDTPYSLDDIGGYGGVLPRFLPLKDGHVFDLGGRHVSVMHTPGHTAGSVCLIDDGERLLLSGDAANPNLLMSFPASLGLGDGRAAQRLRLIPVETAHRALLRVKARHSEFDHNFNGHIMVRDGQCEPLDNCVLDDCINCMAGIMDGSIVKQKIKSPFNGKEHEAALCGKIMLTYDENFIFEGNPTC